MIPPGGGFSPCGSSFVHSVGSLVPKRTRTAVAGSKRKASVAACASADLPQRRHVVQDPETPAVGPRNQV